MASSLVNFQGSDIHECVIKHKLITVKAYGYSIKCMLSYQSISALIAT